MERYIELFPQPLQVSDEGQRRACLIKETSASGESTEKELWFLYPVGVPMPKDDDCDSYLLATLLHAMKLNADITLHGSVSLELLANLTELQYIWKKWCPESYFLVDMKAKHIREDDTQAAGAIVAFSGGADAQFSTYRHATSKAGYATKKLKAGVLVHGFDIPLSDTEGFSGAERMALDALDDLGLSLLSVKTNLSMIWNVNWEHGNGIGVAAVLNGLSEYASVGLIGSGEPYDALLLPWGSHPMTDPLFSSSNFRIFHDGAGFSRSEKIKLLSEWPIGIKNMRICWAGDSRSRNCGACEKCVRSQLNFLLAGVSDPACFSTTLKNKTFDSVMLNSEEAIAHWELIRTEILQTGVGVEWLPQVEQVLKRKATPKFGLILPSGSKRRVLVKKILEKYSK